jgi:hypothetical protein
MIFPTQRGRLVRLTAKDIRKAKLPSGKTDQLFWDDDILGFGLRLRAGSSRSWVFQYALGDKQRRLSLGAATAGKHDHSGLKSERIERAIADDVAWLATHPARRSNRRKQP